MAKKKKVFAVNFEWNIVGGKATLEDILRPDECRFIGTEDDCKNFVKEHKPKEESYDFVSSSENEELSDEWKKLLREKGPENDNKNEEKHSAAPNVASIFGASSQHEKAPIPAPRVRKPGTIAPPTPSGGWHLFIDPVTSAKSVVTASAKKILLKEKSNLRYLGECDEKGNLLTNGKA